MMRAYLLAILTGICIGAAFHAGESLVAAALGWAGAFGLLLTLRSAPQRYLPLYLTGLVTNAIGFHWLTITIHTFGGFPDLATGVVFALYVSLSALQFVLFPFMVRALPAKLEWMGLRIPFAWVISEWGSVRIFPWHLGHTQIATPVAQIADLAGVPLISLLMLWVADLLLSHRVQKRRWLAAAALLSAGLLYGAVRIHQFRALPEPTQPVALLQANISTAQKGNITYFEQNVARYLRLTESVRDPHTLIVWPETVIQEWISVAVGDVTHDVRLAPLAGRMMLIGSLSYTSVTELHNSALAIFPDGRVPPPYHKQILMPFGEYVPFGDVFPWLRALVVTTGDFTPGDRMSVYPFPRADGGVLPTAPLICYEDIVPRLARDAVRQGAELLVNITNDAWFGDTAAPHQHHLLALFRAIENRRWLLRTTNSGLTAVVNPLGETTHALPTFSEGMILAKVLPMSYTSIYTSHVGEWPWLLLVLLGAWCGSVFVFRRESV